MSINMIELTLYIYIVIEDDLLWEEPNAEAADESEADNASELDPYDDRITEEGFAELFGMSDSSDDEFYGF